MSEHTTSSRPPHKYRLVVELTDEQYWTLKNNIDYGLQRKVFSIVIDDMIRMLNEYGQGFIIALLHKEISYKNFMKQYGEKQVIAVPIAEKENG